ncbi:hypothetical protein [Levilactobacillus yiduensis]|uniref:hypothetical protein n=1 Tax=Levilactobacillus yiduensis TaxID=2953880 RepID=UPI000EF31E55|nr:hypothetical protein [Levilactobacillus yiduensis]AYM02141.1 hypothetical protein D8911_03725 [Levilactobacillus brevis]
MSRENLLTYAVILHPEVGRYCVTIPKIGLAWGTTTEAALSMATKLIVARLQNGDAVPEPVAFAELTVPAGDTKTVVRVDTTAYPKHTKDMKKTNTVSSYLNRWGQAAGLNFFQLLTTLKNRFSD